jgi:hypothetical protein
MPEQSAQTRQWTLASRWRDPRVRLASIVGLTLLCSVLLPAVPIFVGVFLVLAVALHAWSPELRPYVDTILRVPIGRPSMRRARLLTLAGAGGLLILVGSVSARFVGQLRTEWELEQGQREFAEEYAIELLARARSHLSKGDLEGAELALMGADATVILDAEWQAELDGLLELVRHSNDPEGILSILIGLPQAEFEDFAKGASVPEALEFGEHALTKRAVELARIQLPEARRARSG